MKRLPVALLALVLAGCPGRGSTDGGPSRGDGPEARINLAVRDLFRAYENEDVQAFQALVHPEFTGRDRTGNDYRAADLPRALRDDFQVMQRIRFDVRAGSPLVRESEGTARVEVQWGLRFLPENGGEEQILTEQRTVLTFVRTEDGRWLLFSITGAPIFGVADRSGNLRR